MHQFRMMYLKALLCTQEAKRTSFIHTKPNSTDFVCLLPGSEIWELRGRTKWTTSLESESRDGHMPRWTSSRVEKSHMQAWKRAGVLQLLNIVHHYHFQEGHAHKLQASESSDELPRRWTKKSFSGQSHRTEDEKHFQPAHHEPIEGGICLKSSNQSGALAAFRLQRRSDV